MYDACVGCLDMCQRHIIQQQVLPYRILDSLMLSLNLMLPEECIYLPALGMLLRRNSEIFQHDLDGQRYIEVVVVIVLGYIIAPGLEIF